MSAKAHNHHGPVARVEDARLTTGSGKYAADWNVSGQLHAAFVRSDRAHAQIVSVDTGKAAKHPGVHVARNLDAALLLAKDLTDESSSTAAGAVHLEARG